MEIDDLTAKLETVSSECLQLLGKHQSLRQELLSMKGIQKKCEKLQNKNKELRIIKPHMSYGHEYSTKG